MELSRNLINLQNQYIPTDLLVYYSQSIKILEIVTYKITQFLGGNNILPPLQFGFRREQNSVHPLIRVRNMVKNKFADQKSTGMVLLDIKAAFD